MAQRKSYKQQAKNVKSAAKAAKKHPIVAAIIVIVLIIIIAAAAILYFCTDIFKKPSLEGGTGGGSVETGGSGTGETGSGTGGNTDISSGQLTDITSANLSIHFLELGNKYNGDSILIKCGDTEVLIDAGSRQASAATIKSYVDTYCTDGKLEYVIATHADQDHISGFVGNTNSGTVPRTGILYQYEIGTLIKFDKVTTSKQTQTLYKNFETAVSYAAEHGANVYTASQCYDETDGAQRQYYLDEAHTISLNILYNYYYYNVSTDENEHSVVTLLTEETESGAHQYLFTGDLEKNGESAMVDYYSNSANSKSAYDILPEVDLFKAGHHGSGTSSTEKLLDVIKPKAVAICCCCGAPEYTKDPANVFPYQATCERLMHYTENIYITSLATGLPEIGDDGKFVSQSYGDYTSMNGTIVFYSADGEIKLYCSNNTTKLKDTEWYSEYRT